MIPDEVVLLLWELFAASVFACFGDIMSGSRDRGVVAWNEFGA